MTVAVKLSLAGAILPRTPGSHIASLGDRMVVVKPTGKAMARPSPNRLKLKSLRGNYA